MTNNITREDANTLQLFFEKTLEADAKAKKFLTKVYALPGVKKTEQRLRAGEITVHFRSSAKESLEEIRPFLPLINPQKITINGEIIQI